MTVMQQGEPRTTRSTTGTGERNYHAFTTCTEPGPWLAAVQDQIGSWLRSKKRWDVDLNVDRTYLEPARTLSARSHLHGNERALRVVLDEDSPTGRWTTRITAVEEERGGGWVAVDVTSEAGQFVAVPGVARYLIGALHLTDGGLELSDEPRVFGVDRLDELVGLLDDPTRRGAVFVAGTDEQLPFETFRARVKVWAHEVGGLGHVVVLDPAATAELEKRLGRSWTAPAWTIRTYLPGMDRLNGGAARNHRILSTGRLAQDSDKYLRTLLGGFAREVVARHPTPPALASWQRTFDRLDNSAITEAMTTAVGTVTVFPSPVVDRAPAPAIEQPTVAAVEPSTSQVGAESAVVAAAEAYLADLERVRELLGLADLTDESLHRLAELATAPRTDPTVLSEAARLIDRQQARIEDLTAAIDETKEDLLNEQIDHLETREELELQAGRASWLGRELAAAGRHDAGHAPVPEEEMTATPDSYAELLDRAKDLECRGVLVTADRGTVLGLEAIDSTGKALHVAWDALLALAGYVAAREAGDTTSTMHHYLQNTPSGYRGLPPGKHSWTETGITMQQFGDERDLPVPTTVDPSGYATMRAHFKLARIGTMSPRLYYLDDIAGTGRVYVGYIGPHMTNTQT